MNEFEKELKQKFEENLYPLAPDDFENIRKKHSQEGIEVEKTFRWQPIFVAIVSVCVVSLGVLILRKPAPPINSMEIISSSNTTRQTTSENSPVSSTQSTSSVKDETSNLLSKGEEVYSDNDIESEPTSILIDITSEIESVYTSESWGVSTSRPPTTSEDKIIDETPYSYVASLEQAATALKLSLKPPEDQPVSEEEPMPESYVPLQEQASVIYLLGKGQGSPTSVRFEFEISGFVSISKEPLGINKSDFTVSVADGLTLYYNETIDLHCERNGLAYHLSLKDVDLERAIQILKSALVG